MEVGGRYVGIDLGKRTYEMCAIESKGKISRTGGKADKEGLSKLCEKLGADDAVAMESCSLAQRLERQIRKDVGCKVYILNPKRLAIIYASTRKTDKEDSLKLAKLLRTHGEDELPTVTPPTEEELERRRLLSEYRSLKRQRTREINRLHAIFEHNGHTQFTRKNMMTEKSRSEILPLLKGYEKGEAERLVERLTLIERQAAELYGKINAEVERDKNAQRAMTVPGIGPITALSYVAYMGDLNRLLHRLRAEGGHVVHDSEVRTHYEEWEPPFEVPSGSGGVGGGEVQERRRVEREVQIHGGDKVHWARKVHCDNRQEAGRAALHAFEDRPGL